MRSTKALKRQIYSRSQLPARPKRTVTILPMIDLVLGLCLKDGHSNYPSPALLTWTSMRSKPSSDMSSMSCTSSTNWLMCQSNVITAVISTVSSKILYAPGVIMWRLAFLFCNRYCRPEKLKENLRLSLFHSSFNVVFLKL